MESQCRIFSGEGVRYTIQLRLIIIIQLRFFFSAGIIIAGLIKVDTSFVKSQIEYNLSIEPKLKLQTDIDFYSNVNLCMRLVQPDSIYK